MSSSRSTKPKSKEMTWSENELAQHILKDPKKLAGSDGGQKKQSQSSRQSQKGQSSSVPRQGLSSTVPAGREVDRRRRGGGEGSRERLASTTAATSSRVSERGRGGERRHKREEEMKRKSHTDESSSPRVAQHRKKDESKETRTQEERRKDRDVKRPASRRGREDTTRRRNEKERERGRRKDKERLKVTESKEKLSSITEKEKHSQEKTKEKPREVEPNPMKEVREGEEDIEEEEDFEYEEDFEEDDYVDDDFEDNIEEEEEESESDGVSNDARSPPATNPDPTSSSINLVEIMKAIEAENKELAPPLQMKPTIPGSQLEPAVSPVDMSLSSRDPQSSQRSTSRRKFVDFSSAKISEERERVAKVTKKRGQELLAMIELDVVTFDLFELRPLTEYELYMRSYGLAGTRQVGVQSGEDTSEVETQTEKTEVKEKWVQWPPEDLRGYGGGEEEEGEEEEIRAAGSVRNAARLNNFIKRASQVLCVLLEENLGHGTLARVDSNQSQIPFCSTKMTLQPPRDLLGDCTLTSAEFSPVHPHLVMTIHVPKKEEEMQRALVPHGGGAVCVWSTKEPSHPQYLLVSQSPCNCGCFGPHKTPLVFSATEDGSVVLWDLRETVAMHTRPPGLATPIDHTLLPRAPTYSTAGIAHKSSHQSPIVSLSPITSSSSSSSSPALFNMADEEQSLGLSFQLASLDRSGLLIIWVAVETKPHPQGSESDLGLIPNGRVKLVQSSAINTIQSSPHSIPTQTLCFQFHSTDTRHIFIGTDEGYVVHQTRYNSRPIPRRYQSQINHTPCPCDVHSLSFSPWEPDYFLAGYSNGSISLYHTKKESALLTWSESTNGIAVCQVRWAWHHPGMFLVLDNHSTLYLWQLMENDRSPTTKFKMDSEHIESFSLSPPPPLSSSFPSSTSSSLTPSIALCLSSREAHHYLSIHLLSPEEPQINQDTLKHQLIPNFTNYLQTL